MSMEEDFLMRRVREIVKALRERDVLEECRHCGTLLSADGRENCPNCQKPLREDETEEQEVEQVEAPPETIGGQPAVYEEASREQLHQEITNERQLFTPANTRKADLVEMLRTNDRDRAAKAAESEQG